MSSRIGKCLLLVALACACSSELPPRVSSSRALSVSASPTAGILANTSTTGGVIFFPSAGVDLPSPTMTPVTGIPASCTLPQGAVYYEADHALVACFNASKVLVVETTTASVVDTIDTTGKFSGSGTIAVSPDLQYALGATGAALAVLRAPFSASSEVTTLTLPGSVSPAQGQAIVFDPAGNAYIRYNGGITVLSPPYTAIAFTIPVTGAGGVGITPDGTQLITPSGGAVLQILTAPFSASSTPVSLTITGATLNGIMVSPDGSCAIAAGSNATKAYAIAAPFSASSAVETLALPTTGSGFEDVGISSDGQFAILAGGTLTASDPLVVIQAPFTAAGATIHTVTPPGGRGAGSFRFLPPGLAPGPTLAATAPASAATGADVTVTLTYGNSGTGPLSNTVIKVPVPAGATFSSASAGGTLTDGIVTWNVGSVEAAASGLTVSFVLHVTATEGSVTVSGASIKGDSSGQILATPVSVEVEPTFAVSFETDGTPGATLTGSTSQSLVAGADATPVTANAPAGYTFAGWTGTGGFAATAANPLTVSGVSAAMTITAHFAAAPHHRSSGGCSTGGDGSLATMFPFLLLGLWALRGGRRSRGVERTN